jgi:hypothetical protein
MEEPVMPVGSDFVSCHTPTSIDSDQEEQHQELEQARAALARWQTYLLDDLEHGHPPACRIFLSPYLGRDITYRIQRALSGCSTAEEVRIVFASVADQQLLQ